MERGQVCYAALPLVLASLSRLAKFSVKKMYSHIRKSVVDIPNHSMITQVFKWIRHKKIKGNKISEPDSFDLNHSDKVVTVKNVH